MWRATPSRATLPSTWCWGSLGWWEERSTGLPWNRRSRPPSSTASASSTISPTPTVQSPAIEFQCANARLRAHVFSTSDLRMLLLVLCRAKHALYIASGVENPDDLQGLGFMPIDDQVRIDQKEPVPLVGQFVAPMADAGVLRQLDHGVVQRVKNPAGSFDVVVGDVVPDVVDILLGARREDASLHPLPR